MSTNRRNFVSAAAISMAGLAISDSSDGKPKTTVLTTSRRHTGANEFRFCLNTSTIREPKLGIEKEVEIAAAAGYDSIEPWIPTLREFTAGGGKLADLGKRISDSGLTVESAIGFAQWIADDPTQREDALEEARRDMDMLRAIGGTRIAAPPVGAHKSDAAKIDLRIVAERFRTLLEVGDQAEIVPQLEIWGFSTNLSRLGDVMYVIGETGHPKACLLLDIYHIFKGGSDFTGLNLLSDTALQVFHINDYPATPSREVMDDSHRIYPGDGIAPMSKILNSIGGSGRSIVLSLELFNRDYWKQDPLEVAKTGLAKMKSAVEKATNDKA
jgi:2-keto-myo-inositol isomerase